MALFGSKGDTRFDVVSPETGEDPQLLALELQAEAFARPARTGAVPEGTSADRPILCGCTAASRVDGISTFR